MTQFCTLEIQHLIKGYSIGERHLLALDDLSLCIPQGQFVSLVGASGCGKSTLLRLIAGLERDFFGNLRFGEGAIVGPSLDRGIVFQDPGMMPWLTAAQNIEFALLNAPISSAAKRSRVSRAIEVVRIEGFEHKLPREFSTGVAQRVAIARMLVNGPRLILLDDPFAELDESTRASLQDLLLEIWQSARMTVVLATCDVHEALYLSDRVIDMSAQHGRIHRDMKVPLSRPRNRNDPNFGRLRKSLLPTLSSKVQHQLRRLSSGWWREVNSPQRRRAN